MNKKLLLSILIIAFVGIAAAGTWANYVVTEAAGGNTLKAGTIDISLNKANNQPFQAGPMVPDSTTDKIMYHQCWWFWGSDKHYDITVTNTGDIDASLFLSDVLTSNPSSLADNVKLYYSETDSGTPIEITGTPADTGFNIPAGQSKKLYFWYSYANNGDQTAEMGQIVDAVINFELRNPDTSVPGSGI